MKKELHKINLLVAVINDSAASENEKEVSRIKITKYCKKLISKSGIDSSKQENWLLSGLLRFMFEKNRVTFNIFNKRDKDNLEKLKHVLSFHNVKYREANGNGKCFKRILI